MTFESSSAESTVVATDRLVPWVEAVAVFLLGFIAMNLFYAGSVATPGSEIGVPGRDSFYHIAMASLLPDLGAMKEFPWLEYVYFRDQGEAFVSHHWGFHLLLLPFVKLAEWTVGDPLAGGRWAMSAVFGANLLLFHLLLRLRKVPLHWLWIALFFFLPDQFLARHGFVRAIGPSLLFMQLILFALFSSRRWLAGLAVGAYVHLYLGAVLFGPILVATFFAASAFGPKDDRQVPWRVAFITGAAWILGVVTYPYAGGIFEFLRLQVFGSGLTPDIEVGREWKPYTNAWFLIKMAAPLLIVWVGALVLRLRTGPRLDAAETTLIVLQFAFLVLTFKARRFIEYWPPFCLTSAAFIAAPPLRELGDSARAWFGSRPRATTFGFSIIGAVAIATLALLAWMRVGEDASLFLDHWVVWAVPVALLAVATVVRVVSGSSGPASLAVLRAGVVLLIAALVPAATLAFGANRFSSASSQLRCYYDLDEIESMMGALEERSAEGDLVFTDDWDVFGAYFFFNRHNRYIVGLDPKFTHQREPDLWNRYVKISRGQVPSTIRLASSDSDDERESVVLEDIRKEFGARYVITDHDHRRLSDALFDAPEFAELVYPEGEAESVKQASYLVFRIREAGEVVEVAEESTPEDPTAPLFLSEIGPLSVSQGWGDLGSNRTVDGNAIRLAGENYRRGIGTHAPARILYDIPAGYDRFEAIVGIDDETDGKGSAIAAVRLDGRLVYESPELRGGDAPAIVHIPLEGAHQIQLEAGPTSDGQQFDHVCWAEARLVPSSIGTSQSMSDASVRP